MRRLFCKIISEVASLLLLFLIFVQISYIHNLNLLNANQLIGIYSLYRIPNATSKIKLSAAHKTMVL